MQLNIDDADLPMFATFLAEVHENIHTLRELGLLNEERFNHEHRFLADCMEQINTYVAANVKEVAEAINAKYPHLEVDATVLKAIVTSPNGGSCN